MKPKYNLLVYRGDYVSYTLSRWTFKGNTSVGIPSDLARLLLDTYESCVFKNENEYTIYSIDLTKRKEVTT